MKKNLVPVALILLAPLTAQARCKLEQPPSMNLGTYTGSVSSAGSTNITVTCNGNSANYTISLDAGTRIGATTSTRKMTGPASATLNYGLFRDAARAQNWGNNAGVDTASGSGSTSVSNFTIYPQIAAGQLVAPGTYRDTMTTASGAGSGSFTITTLVQPLCQITATNLAFGTYTGADLDAVSTLTVTCTKTTPYYVNLSDGQHPDGSFLPRAIGPGGVLLAYTMFRDAARSSRWGNTYNLDGVAATGSGSAETLNVYGRVAGGQFVTPGAYTDTVIATITY
ncbi:MAG: spore coat protein U domain-containing protein [Polaromonas sp.]|nr:spore coat protein U domain-containing protein [Polaromonas sp.]